MGVSEENVSVHYSLGIYKISLFYVRYHLIYIYMHTRLNMLLRGYKKYVRDFLPVVCGGAGEEAQGQKDLVGLMAPAIISIQWCGRWRNFLFFFFPVVSST